MPALVAGIHVFEILSKERRGWPGHRRFVETPFFERLCPAMTIQKFTDLALVYRRGPLPMPPV
jgi:hypothetical protein